MLKTTMIPGCLGIHISWYTCLLMHFTSFLFMTSLYRFYVFCCFVFPAQKILPCVLGPQKAWNWKQNLFLLTFVFFSTFVSILHFLSSFSWSSRLADVVEQSQFVAKLFDFLPEQTAHGCAFALKLICIFPCYKPGISCPLVWADVQRKLLVWLTFIFDSLQLVLHIWQASRMLSRFSFFVYIYVSRLLASSIRHQRRRAVVRISIIFTVLCCALCGKQVHKCGGLKSAHLRASFCE